RLQLFQLAGIWVFERQSLQVARFQILTNPSAPQQIPTMIARHFIKPRRKWPRRIVHPEFLPYLHEYFSRSVFRIFARRQSPPAEPENRRSILAIQVAPGVRIARPDLR